MDFFIKDLVRRPNLESIIHTNWLIRDIDFYKYRLYIQYLESLIKQIPETSEIPEDLIILRQKLKEWSEYTCE